MRYSSRVFLTLLGFTASASATVNVSNPVNGAKVTSPVHYVATSTATNCSKGVASMGIYVNNKLVQTVMTAKVDTEVTLNEGAQHTVVEEWDKCGGASYESINLTVESGSPDSSKAPTVSISSRDPSISDGSTTALSVTAKNATAVSIIGSDGSNYSLSTSGGVQSVSPTATTTYTAEVTGKGKTVTASTTIKVTPVDTLKSVQHVLFMLQENHSFDNYFGMLNPYRKANGWDVGSDGVEYDVDGIDDKLETISNTNGLGDVFQPFKFRTSCIDSMTPAWYFSYKDVSTLGFGSQRPIKMDGFVKDSESDPSHCKPEGSCQDMLGQRPMGYYDEDFLNYYYYMASQFAVSDRWFSPISSASNPNRIAMMTGGTTQGLVENPGLDHLPQLNIPSIFEELDNAKVSWKIYYSATQGGCASDNDCPPGGSARFPATYFTTLKYSDIYLYGKSADEACKAPTKPSSVVGDSSDSFCIDPEHIAPLSTYYLDLKNGTLPSFALIEAGYAVNDEHPGALQSVLVGQAQVAKIIDNFMASSSWKNSIFFFAYDEGGGAYDHVPPVPGSSNINTDPSLGTIPDISQIAVNADRYGPCLPPGKVPTLHCDLAPTDPGAKSTDAAAVEGFAAQLGFRVPNMIISPFTRRHYVSHTPMDHTAVIKFVENRFIGSSAHLTARDAAQPSLLEFFDFSDVPWLDPPTPPTPVNSASLHYNPCNAANMGR